jgi:hypothetical protein
MTENNANLVNGVAPDQPRLSEGVETGAQQGVFGTSSGVAPQANLPSSPGVASQLNLPGSSGVAPQLNLAQPIESPLLPRGLYEQGQTLPGAESPREVNAQSVESPQSPREVMKQAQVVSGTESPREVMKQAQQSPGSVVSKDEVQPAGGSQSGTGGTGSNSGTGGNGGGGGNSGGGSGDDGGGDSGGNSGGGSTYGGAVSSSNGLIYVDTDGLDAAAPLLSSIGERLAAITNSTSGAIGALALNQGDSYGEAFAQVHDPLAGQVFGGLDSAASVFAGTAEGTQVMKANYLAAEDGAAGTAVNLRNSGSGA